MFPMSKSIVDGVREASIIPMDSIIRPCQLFLKFAGSVDRSWTADNVLERCEDFLFNNWTDHHMYAMVF